MRATRRPPAAALLTVLMLAAPAAAQDKAAGQKSPLEIHGAFTTLPGIPSVNVTAVLEDKNGFLWFGTASGLTHWNGRQFQMVELGAITSPVSALAESGELLWVGTDDGAHVLDGFRKRVDKPCLAGRAVLWLVAAGDDLVWAGTSAGVVRLDRRCQVTTETALATFAPVTAAAAADDGDLLLGTETGAVLRYDPKTRAIEQQVAVKAPISAVTQTAGAVWIGTLNKGLFRLDESGTRAVPGPPVPHPHVTSIANDGQSLWVGTLDGLCRMRSGESAMTVYLPRPQDVSSLPNNKITSLSVRPGGSLMIGTHGGGVVLSPSKDAVPRYTTAFAGGKSRTIISSTRVGNIIWGAQTGGMLKLDRASREATFYPELLDDKGNRIQFDFPTGLTEAHGKLWVGNEQNGLLSFDPDTTRMDAMGTRLGIPRAMRIIQLPNYQLLLATWGLGVVTVDLEKNRIDAPFEGRNDFVLLYDMAVDPDEPDGAWIADARQGLARYDMRNGQLNPLPLGQGDARLTVTSVAFSKGGVLWAGTYGLGLFKVSTGSKKVLKTYRVADGLASNLVEDVLVDDQGNVWVLTLKGLRVILPDGSIRVVFDEEMFDGADDEAVQGHLRYFGDEMFVGTTNGLFVFDPAKLLAAPRPPSRLALTSFTVLGKDYPLDAPIWQRPSVTLDYATLFSVDFASLPGAANKRRIYRYKLAGFHDEWIETDQGTVTFSNLDAGDYELAIQERTDALAWSKPVTLALEVLPPWWRTIWAYIGYGLLALLAFALVFRYYRAKIRRVEERQRLANLEQQLALTAAVQEGFLPKDSYFQGEEFLVCGYYQPAEICSGDWWWYEQRENGSLLVVVGDATGHGAASAMLTAAAAAAFRTHIDASIEDRLRATHDEVRRVANGRLLVAATVVHLQPDTGRFTTWGAAGLPVLQMTPGSPPRAIPMRGAPLGSKAFMVESGSGVLRPGERLLTMTDGIIEAPMPSGRPFGFRRFARLLASTAGISLEPTVTEIIVSARKQLATTEQGDDWTLVAVERRGER